VSDAMPLDAQIQEAKRELRMRYGVYGKKLGAGTMTQIEYDRGIGLQKAIVASLERLKGIDERLL
jgi:hypothetical protein